MKRVGTLFIGAELLGGSNSRRRRDWRCVAGRWLREVVNDFKGVGQFSSLLEHDRRGAVFLMREFDCAFNEVGLEIAPAYCEVKVHFGEDFWILFCTLGFKRNVAAPNVLMAFPQDQDDIIGGAAAGSGKDDFHWPRCQVPAATFRCAVHRDKVSGASFG